VSNTYIHIYIYITKNTDSFCFNSQVSYSDSASLPKYRLCYNIL